MTKSLIRMRMSSHDAHYGGNLVDEAKMLQLFNDVATELLIINDGDEGLFCAYDNVEFLAPVFAGDYIEAIGEITSVGNSSRKMKFEARKVIARRERHADPGRQRQRPAARPEPTACRAGIHRGGYRCGAGAVRGVGFRG